MKKNQILLLILFTICAQIVSAQQFRLIPADQDRLYVQSDNRIFSAEVKSLSSAGSEELIEMEGLTEIHWSPAYCYHNTAPDILGKQILVDDSGDHLIQMDATGELIATIKTQALVNESWNCLEHNGNIVTATCISNAIGSVNGIPELIKTIRFSNDFCDLKISQTQGIISSPAWNQLYENVNALNSNDVICLERIWDEHLIEKLHTPFGDLAADLQVGDVLHIEDSYSIIFSDARRRYIKATFLEKTYDPELHSYTLIFKEEVQEWRNYQGQITESEYIDTTEYSLRRYLNTDNELIDYPVPINRIFDAGGLGDIFNYSLFKNKLKLYKAGISFSFSEEDNCFPFVYDIGEGFDYIEGLAGPYYKHQVFYPRERTLKYYKKGNEEWGTPYTFTVSTKDRATYQPVTISPNPVSAGEEIYIHNNFQITESDIHLMDLHGRVIQSENNTSGNFRIKSGIGQGMYIIVVQNMQHELFRSKLMIR